MRKNSIILFAVLSVLLTACWNEPEFIDVIELGARNKVIKLDTHEYGDSTFSLISNVDYQLEINGGNDWLVIDEASAEHIRFSYPANNGFKRSASLILTYKTRTDVLRVLQPGLYNERISFSESLVDVPAEGGEYSVDVLTNVQTRDLAFEASSSKAITDVSLENNRLQFTVPAATSRDTKVYTVTVYTVDGWGERVESVLKVKQQSK